MRARTVVSEEFPYWLACGTGTFDLDVVRGDGLPGGVRACVRGPLVFFLLTRSVPGTRRAGAVECLRRIDDRLDLFIYIFIYLCR